MFSGGTSHSARAEILGPRYVKATLEGLGWTRVELLIEKIVSSLQWRVSVQRGGLASVPVEDAL